MKQKIFSHQHKFITVDVLLKMAGPMLYDEFAKLVYACIEDNVMDPVKSSGTNGRRPALYNKYRICRSETDYTNAQKDIKMLHPSFNHSKYAKHPEVYVKHKEEINMLSRFLWEHAGQLQHPMSINERSFQIWGQEKLLKDRSVIAGIFNYNELDLSLLNFYETPEPFFEYIHSNEDEMNILIIENKDTWFSLRKIIREDKVNHLFRQYHVLLYGEGKKIISRNDRLKEYDRLLPGSRNCYYYFGDLDFEGIEIYNTLVDTNKELNISLCTELYAWMLQKSTQYDLPKTKAGQRVTDIQAFLTHFNERECQSINHILHSGLYIPQEILNYSLLKNKMMEGL